MVRGIDGSKGPTQKPKKMGTLYKDERKVVLQKVFHPIISPHGIVYSLDLESTIKF